MGILLGGMKALGTNAEDSARSSLISSTQSDILNVATEIAAAIGQDMMCIADSVAMTTALQSDVLYTEGDILATAESYPEFNFAAGCAEPDCPSDYSPLEGRSRLAGVNGSLDHSSLYVYSSATGAAIKSQSALDTLLASYDRANTAATLLAHLDPDFQVMYESGPTSTVFFYNSVRALVGTNGTYISLHRTYPGIAKDATDYDATQRPWFLHAPTDDVYLQGPYIETFTGKSVVTLSSRRSINAAVEVVGAAVMDLEGVTALVSGVTYLDSGFAALVKRETQEVLVYGDTKGIYDESTLSFELLSTVAPELTDSASLLLSGTPGVEDVTLDGEDWLCAHVPFLPVTDGLSGASSTAGGFSGTTGFSSGQGIFSGSSFLTSSSSAAASSSLVLLLFAKREEALSTMTDLSSAIDATTADVDLLAVIGCLAVGLATLAAVAAVVLSMRQPLHTVQVVATRVAAISGDEDRNYSAAAADITCKPRCDELGRLVATLRLMVAALHRVETARRDAPKYPPNPFCPTNSIHVLLPAAAPLPPTPAGSVAAAAAGHGSRWAPSLQGAAAASSVASAPPQDSPPPGAQSQSRGGGVRQSAKSSALIAPERASEQAALAKSTEPKTWLLCGLATRLFSCAALLLGGLLVVAALCTKAMQNNDWMESTGQAVEAEQKNTLQRIADAKADFVEAFFLESAIDLGVSARYARRVLAGDLNTSDYLTSYSLNSDDYYAASVSSSDDFSGYFLSDASACSGLISCGDYNQLEEVQLTSLLDIKWRSLAHAHSILDFAQVGLEDSGLTRIYPYAYKTYASPTECYVEDTELSQCASLEQECLSGTYPPYDPRCRSWYTIATDAAAAATSSSSTGSSGGGGTGAGSGGVQFGYPRVSSSGDTVVTASVALTSDGGFGGKSVDGVIITNVLAATLSDSVNGLAVLREGYSYLVDASSPEYVLLHPGLEGPCQKIRCSEPSFSDAEYQAFYDSVLVPVAAGETPAEQYEKGGEAWILKTAAVALPAASLRLFVTVPLSDVLDASVQVQNDIDDAVHQSITAVAVFLALLGILLMLLTGHTVLRALQQISALQLLCQNIAADNLDGDTLKGRRPTSRDIELIMAAFGGMLVAVRFASDSYSRGDLAKAEKAYQEALDLFTKTNHKRGVGVANNNLGAVALNRRELALADDRYTIAVSMARDAVEAARGASATSAASAAAVLSSRLGNLALVRIEQGRYPEAYQLLEEGMEMDKAGGRTLGLVVKQGTLGTLFLRQTEMQEARRIFESSLEFIRTADEDAFDARWNSDELPAAEQVALFNMGSFYQSSGDAAEAERCYRLSLTKHSAMDEVTTRKTLAALEAMWREAPDPDSRAAAVALVGLMAELGWAAGGAASAAASGRDVAFVLDYSGSMSGSRIRAAVRNLVEVFDHHISDRDRVTLITFNHQSCVRFPLQEKGRFGKFQRSTIESLRAPVGGTALYDAINDALNQLRQASTADLSWVVALTDGEDNSSRLKVEELTDRLRASRIAGLVVIAVGASTDVSTLRQLAECGATKSGAFLLADGSTESIDRAFAQVAQLIQGQVVLEAF